MSAQGAAGVVTPEAVVLQVQRAGPGSRILARLLDQIIQYAAIFLFLVLAGVVAGGSLGTVGTIVVLAMVPLVLFGYPAILEATWHGRTVGKAAFGLRVVTNQGAPVRFRHTIIRSALYIVDGMLIGPVIGVLLLVFTKDTVRLGDLAAGTSVIRVNIATSMPTPVSFRPPAGYDEYASHLDVSGITPADYEIIRGFLLRASTLNPDARWSLSVQIATPIAHKLRHQVPPSVHPEAFLVSVAAAYQQRSAGHWSAAPPQGTPRPHWASSPQWASPPPTPPAPADPPPHPPSDDAGRTGGFAPPS